MKEFTLNALTRYNGKNGMPAYIAYKGQVRDVTDSFLWQNGKHQVIHKAGEDLTSALEKAPHGEDLLKKFPVIGILKEE